MHLTARQIQLWGTGEVKSGEIAAPTEKKDKSPAKPRKKTESRS